MTTETVHPNHTATAEELIQRLKALSHTEGETALTLRIIVRNGVARKWKWNVEDESDPCTKPICLTDT